MWFNEKPTLRFLNMAKKALYKNAASIPFLLPKHLQAKYLGPPVTAGRCRRSNGRAMAVSTYFQDRETEEEERVKEQQFNSIIDVEVGHRAAVERLSGAFIGKREHYRTTPFHVQLLEDRINKVILCCLQ